jgi:hypothetical protein
MPKERLTEGFKHVLAEIYKPKNYFDRLFTLIKRFPKENINRNYASMTLHMTGFLETQLLKSLSKHLKIGMVNSFVLYKMILNHYMFDVLKFLIHVLRYNYRYFTYAIHMTARGYHFIKLAKTIVASESNIERQEKSVS